MSTKSSDVVKMPEAYAKCADPALQKDVDVMILDHLIFKATNVLLEECENRRKGDLDMTRGDNHLKMVDSEPLPQCLQCYMLMLPVFLQIFKKNHPTYDSPAELSFRLELLQFTTTFVRRLERDFTTPTMKQLRTLRIHNSERARRWYEGQPQRSQSELGEVDTHTKATCQGVDNRIRTIGTLYGGHAPSRQPSESWDLEFVPSLLDLLPAFMSLSASAGASAGNIPSTRWMVLAAEFMLQAAYEMTMSGMRPSTAVQEAFAWGCYAGISAEEDRDGIDQGSGEVDAMFRDVNTNAELDDWTAIRSMHLEELASQIGDPRSLESEHPITKFERDTCCYLDGLSSSVPLPIIAQLERGQLDGLSERETEAFRRRVGFEDCRNK